ncbi:unnamed protein product [Rhodiola kirilowii]
MFATIAVSIKHSLITQSGLGKELSQVFIHMCSDAFLSLANERYWSFCYRPIASSSTLANISIIDAKFSTISMLILTVGPRTYRLTTKAIPSVLLLMRCRSRTCELNKEMSAGHGI